MKLAILIVVAWLWISIALLRFWPIRRRPDVWPLTLIWPVLLAYIVFILLYEGLGRAARGLWDLRA